MNTSLSGKGKAKPFSWRFTSPLMLGSALNPINSSMLATALVGIGTDLRVDPGTTASLISALYLASAVAQPTMGKISTLIGPRRTFLFGLAVLFIGGALGAFAPAFGYLVISRILIGIGTSACYPSAMALIRARADASAGGVPTSVLGSLTIAAQITATFGFPLGGVLVGVFGWRTIFAINIPLAVLTIVLTLYGIPKDQHIARTRPTASGRENSWLTALDPLGIVLFAGAIASVLIFLSGLAHPVWWLGGLSVVLLVLLLCWEWRASRPLIDLQMLMANRPLQRTYLRCALVSLANYAALNGLSQWLEQGRGLGAETVGLILVPLAGVAAIISRVTSRRGWVRWPLIIGGLAQGVAGLALLLVTGQTNIFLLIGMTMLLSCYAFGSVGNQATLYLQSPAAEVAVTSGLFRTFNYLGAVFSSSLIGVAFGSRATDSGLHTLAWFLVVIGILIALMSTFDRSVPKNANA